MSVLEIIIVVLFAVGGAIYIFCAIWDLKHPERREEKKQKRLKKREAKENKKNDKEKRENNEDGMY